MQKTRIAAYALIAVLGAGTLGAGVASAKGFGWAATPADAAVAHQAQFQHQADLLGIPVADVIAFWAEGKTFRDLAAARGITDAQLREKQQAARLAHMTAQLQAMVEKGIITQVQADARLAFLKTRPVGQGEGKGGRMRGMGRGAGLHRGAQLGN